MRWLLLLVLMFGWGASYLQRVALSMLAPMLRQELGFTSVQVGWIFGAFPFGLMAGYILMTAGTALYGTRWGLVVAFAGASLAAFASGLTSTLTGIIVARSLLGLFTGGLLPAAVQSVREWFPAHLRPLAIGLIFASSQVAAALTPPLVVFVNQAIAWRTVLMITGIPTLIAAVLCVVTWQSPPPRESSRGVSSGALASVGMLALGLFLAAPIYYFTVTWLPTYLREKPSLGFDRVATASVAVMVAGACGALLVGAVAWALMRRGISPSKTRAVLLTACGLMLPLVALVGSADKWELVILLLAVSSIGYQGWSTLLYSAVADTLPARGVAIGAALGAFMVNLSGTLWPVAFGRMIQTSGYDLVFRVLFAAAVVALVGVGLLAWFVRQEPAGLQEEDTMTSENASVKSSATLFLHIPVARLVLLSIASFSLYDAYWVYKNWWFIKERKGLDIQPFWRGVFGVFFCHSLLKEIHSDPEARALVEPSFSPGGLATVWVILIILGNLIGWAPGATASIIGALLPSFLCLVPIQNYVNSVAERRSPGGRFYPWSSGHIVCVLWGAIGWGLVLFALIQSGQ